MKIYKKTLNITTEILLEYEEIIQKYFSKAIVKDLFNQLKLLPNVHKITPHFKWGLINADMEDNKFVYCAVASNSHCIVTHDKHFNILREIGFPKIKICNINEFSDFISLF